ncbi:MAG: tRNA lysidine(34) synthetase TilS [Firmicutes bacterium]|nr:tRNA lysidine(34) synthetase TilS [Bacillota bacterium]
MLEKVKKTLKRFHMLRAGDRVLVAVSGGPDSTALLHILWRLQGEMGLELLVFHLDHMLRGEESHRDACHVREMAASLGIPALIKKFAVGKYRDKRGLSTQQAARQVRYALLGQVARREACGKIALGHNQNDQVETILMRLIQGTGLQGLAGIPPVRPLAGAQIIRPLLEVTREEILAYCRKEDLQVRWDPSNKEPVYLRNKIRLQLLPLLEEYNPNFQEQVAANAQLWREEDEYLAGRARELYAAAARQLPAGVSLSLQAMEGLPPVLLRRLLRRGIGQVKGGSRDIKQVHLQEAQALVTRGRVGQRLSLPGGLEMKKTYGEVIIQGAGHDREPPAPFCSFLPVPGGTTLPTGVKVRARLLARRELPPHLSSGPRRAFFDYDLLSSPLRVRSRRPGDRFYPLGLAGSKKLKDFFIDEKVPRAQRDQIPLLTSGDDIIVWVMGWRQDERFKVTPGTEQVLQVDLE